MHFYCSAFNTWPEPEHERHDFISELVRKDWAVGLVLPYYDSVTWPQSCPPGFGAILTGLPGTMGHLNQSRTFGLASKDEAGRKAAIEWAREMAHDVVTLISGGHPVRAVQLHAAPAGMADADSLFKALDQLAQWDWGGVRLWLEHCDAFSEEHSNQKGFLALEEEVKVLQAVAKAHPHYHFGISFNWARSVIEGRSVQYANEQVKMLCDSQLLRHVTFSSVSDQDTDWGPAFSDRLLPLRGTPAAPDSSLLGGAELRAFFDNISKYVVWGLNIDLRPAALEPGAMLEALDANAELIRSKLHG